MGSPPGFEWDSDKAEANIRKHGVSFETAAEVFADPLSATEFDADNSTDEDRWVTMGITRSGDLLVVSHTDRDGAIRIISARPATAAERRAYEQ